MMCMKYGTEVKGDAMVYLVTSAVGYEECVTSSSLPLSSLLAGLYSVIVHVCLCVCFLIYV